MIAGPVPLRQEDWLDFTEAMTFSVKVRAAGRTREHVFELPAESDLTRVHQGVLQLRHNGQPLEVDWAQVSAGVFSILMRGHAYQAHVVTLVEDPAGRTDAWAVTLGNTRIRVEVPPFDKLRAVSGVERQARDWRSRSAGRPTGAPSAAGEPQEIRAPMPGKIVKVLVREEQDVSQGQGLLIIEAMKMQNELRAPRAGHVEKVYAQEGKGVEAGALLLSLV